MIKKVIKILYSIVESLIRNIGGGLGQRIRFFYYKSRFKSCGKNIRIDIGVIIQSPENIVIGNDVWIMPYAMIIAKPVGEKIKNRIEKKIENILYEDMNNYDDTLIIGSEIQIGAYNILNAYGGLVLGNRVTLSARVSIYSYSHYYRDDNDKRKVTYANSMVKSDNIACVRTPIVLEEGVWLGVGVSVFGGNVLKNSFVTSGSVVVNDIEENAYANGSPAHKIKERFIVNEYNEE